MDRTEVYRIIDTERDYQERMGQQNSWGQGQGASNHSVGDFLSMLQAYLARAHEAYVSNTGDQATLQFVRKLAGICVACMERHGAEPR